MAQDKSRCSRHHFALVAYVHQATIPFPSVNISLGSRPTISLSCQVLTFSLLDLLHVYIVSEPATEKLWHQKVVIHCFIMHRALYQRSISGVFEGRKLVMLRKVLWNASIHTCVTPLCVFWKLDSIKTIILAICFGINLHFYFMYNQHCCWVLCREQYVTLVTNVFMVVNFIADCNSIHSLWIKSCLTCKSLWYVCLVYHFITGRCSGEPLFFPTLQFISVFVVVLSLLLLYHVHIIILYIFPDGIRALWWSLIVVTLLQVPSWKLPLSRTKKIWRFRALSQREIHHDNIVIWKHFPRYWPFVRENHR